MRFQWTDSEGRARQALAWLGDNPQAVIVCLHGMSGAAEQFEPLPAAMPEFGFVAPELRGQGNDPEVSRRGVRLDLPAQEMDIAALLKTVRAKFPTTPLFLMGESMGALLTADYAARHPDSGLSGIIMSVPVVAMKREVPKIVVQLVRIIGHLAPSLRCKPSLFVNGKTISPPLTRDKSYQDSIRSQPHYISAFTFRFLSELGDLIAASSDTAARIRTPSLTLVAGQDCFVADEQILAWHRLIPGKNKILSVYPEAYHLLWHDWDRDRVLNDVREWIHTELETKRAEEELTFDKHAI